MSRNRKKHARRGNRRLIKTISVLTVVAAMAMVYLFLNNRCEVLGKEIKQLETRQGDLARRLANEERNWAMARTVRNMERLMAEHQIQMGWPAERDIIRLAERRADVDALYAAIHADEADTAMQ